MRPVIILFAVTAVVFSAFSPVAAQQAVVPSTVIRDSGDNIIGPVVGFASALFPIIRIIDTGTGLPVFLEVRGSSQLAVSDDRTYFSGADCTGTPYHNVDPAAEYHSGTSELGGFRYSVSRMDVNNANEQHLIRSGLEDTFANTEFDSFFDPSNDSCTNNASIRDLYQATDVLNIDQLNPPPYSME